MTETVTGGSFMKLVRTNLQGALAVAPQEQEQRRFLSFLRPTNSMLHRATCAHRSNDGRWRGRAAPALLMVLFTEAAFFVRTAACWRLRSVRRRILRRHRLRRLQLGLRF